MMPQSARFPPRHHSTISLTRRCTPGASSAEKSKRLFQDGLRDSLPLLPQPPREPLLQDRLRHP